MVKETRDALKVTPLIIILCTPVTIFLFSIIFRSSILVTLLAGVACIIEMLMFKILVTRYRGKEVNMFGTNNKS